jgi:hypothetical protein
MVETIEKVLKEALGTDLPHGPVVLTTENRYVPAQSFENERLLP